MPLFDIKNAFSGMGKFYTVNVKCRNCGHIGVLRIPKGVTVTDHVSSGDGKCTNCGCGELNAQSLPAEKPTRRATKPLPVMPAATGGRTW